MQSGNVHNDIGKVKDKLLAAYHKSIAVTRRNNLLNAFIILCSGSTAILLLEHTLYFSPLTKSLLLFGLLVITGYAAFFRNAHRFAVSFEAFYRNFSKSSKLPELKDAIDLEASDSGNRNLVNAAILQSLSKVDPQKLNTALHKYTAGSDLFRTYRKLLIIGIGGLILFLITGINLDHAAKRILTFWEGFQKPNPYTFTVSPGSLTLEQGEPLRVNATFSDSELPDAVTLKIKTSVEDNFRERIMEKTGSTYTSIPLDIYNNMKYFIEMDGYKSDTYTVNVQLRPRFLELSGIIIPPSYTNLAQGNFVYPTSQIRGYRGSEVQISGMINKPVRSLMAYTVSDTASLQVRADSTFSYSMNITSADTIQFQIEDSTGLTNDNRFQLIVAPLEDYFPIAEIIEPASSYKQVNPQEIDILYRVTDDFGLTFASLNYELTRAYTNAPVTGSYKLSLPNDNELIPYNWLLNDLNLKPQDKLTFWVTARDNDAYSGYKTSTSQRITLEVPSMVDYLDDVDSKEDDITTDLDEISESFEQTREQYERFKEKLKDNPENTGYEERSELEQVKKQQEEVQKKIDELNEKFKQLKEEMSRDNILSEETQKAYNELQKLIEEIDDPSFRDALEKMLEQLGNMSPEQLRQAMEDLEFNEELYQERLKRTIELFKQLKLTSDLDKLAKSFDDMARKEEEFSENETENSVTSKTEKEESLKENEQLTEKVDELTEHTTDKNRKAVGDYQQSTIERLKEIASDLKNDMQDADSGETNEQNSDSDSVETSESNKPSQPKDRAEQYRKLAENTRSLQSSINQEQMQINIAGLQYVLYSILNLSLEQEDLTTLIAATDNRSQAYVRYARNQQNIESIFSTISDSLFELSAQIPQFSNQINEKKLEVEQRLGRSLEQLTERNQSQSSVASRQTLGGINEIAFMLANLLEQIQDSEGGGQGSGGMSSKQIMEQLQQSGQQQQQLNQQLQNIINDIQGDRLTQDRIERLNQLAEQQNMIRKQLQELQRSGEFDGDRLGSELQRMIEEMEDTINDLRGGNTDAVMIERQQNILSRMLQAEKAIQERDEEDKREGQAAEDYQRNNPPELTIEELEKQIRNRLNDPNFTKFSPDYQRLIQNYFDLLKKLQDREIQ